MILLMKRHFSKFISFYILRRDYLRMRCVERSDDEGGVNRANLRPLSSDNQSISQNLLGGNRSGATRYETLSEFRRVLASNMRIYHHMIGLCPPKVLTFLKNTLKLPCQIVCTLIIAGLIINLSLSLAFSQAFCKEEGDSQETCLSGHIITVTLIDAILSMVAIVFLTQIISGNYLHFLKDNRTPQSGPRLRPESSAGDAIN